MTDAEYLARAVGLSEQSPEDDGCGVVITVNDEILAEAYNSQNVDNIAVYHAEIKALIAANRKTGRRKLPEATAYCSCEPCAMCLAALSYAKIPRIVFHKRMAELFPDDPQGQFDSKQFVDGLNFTPVLDYQPVLE